VVDTVEVSAVPAPPKVIDPSQPVGDDEVMVGVYNVENLFDCKKDEGIYDDQFTPDGDYKWTEAMVAKKIQNLGKVVRTMNGGKGPDILALTEIENKPILERFRDEALGDLGYESLVHLETADWRGIDNAILSRHPQIGKAKLHEFHRPEDPLWGKDTSRGVLEATFDVQGVPLTVLVAHLPRKMDWSRRTKQRLDFATQLGALMAELQKANPDREILLLGDFNGNPGDDTFDASGMKASGSKQAVLQQEPGASTYNTVACMADQLAHAKGDPRVNDLAGVDELLKTRGSELGTLKWKDDWYLLDHILVSRGLLDDAGLSWIPGSTQVVREEFMVDDQGIPKTFYEDDVKPKDQKLSKTGFSDHLPMVTRLRRHGPT